MERQTTFKHSPGFEEFAVYDCRIKQNKDDHASKARIFYCTFRDYEEKWNWISSIFSRESILKGSFDKFSEANRAKRGTAEVDADFLQTIEGWRADLARTIALRNEMLSQHALNFSVQSIIDRIVLLRICEDRGIEDYGRLLALANKTNIYTHIVNLFREADNRYNSGLFCFKKESGRIESPDLITPTLVIDDKILKEIIKSLYYPDSPGDSAH